MGMKANADGKGTACLDCDYSTWGVTVVFHLVVQNSRRLPKVEKRFLFCQLETDRCHPMA
jgi:hypothetical protein